MSPAGKILKDKVNGKRGDWSGGGGYACARCTLCKIVSAVVDTGWRFDEKKAERYSN